MVPRGVRGLKTDDLRRRAPEKQSQLFAPLLPSVWRPRSMA